MTNEQEQEKISELEQRILALTADKNELQTLNTSLNKQLEELTNEKEHWELEQRLLNLKTPSHQFTTNPSLRKIELEKTILIIFLLITLAAALLLK